MLHLKNDSITSYSALYKADLLLPQSACSACLAGYLLAHRRAQVRGSTRRFTCCHCASLPVSAVSYPCRTMPLYLRYLRCRSVYRTRRSFQDHLGTTTCMKSPWPPRAVQRRGGPAHCGAADARSYCPDVWLGQGHFYNFLFYLIIPKQHCSTVRSKGEKSRTACATTTSGRDKEMGILPQIWQSTSVK